MHYREKKAKHNSLSLHLSCLGEFDHTFFFLSNLTSHSERGAKSSSVIQRWCPIKHFHIISGIPVYRRLIWLPHLPPPPPLAARRIAQWPPGGFGGGGSHCPPSAPHSSPFVSSSRRPRKWKVEVMEESGPAWRDSGPLCWGITIAKY